jgi:hypothetical protein
MGGMGGCAAIHGAVMVVSSPRAALAWGTGG